MTDMLSRSDEFILLTVWKLQHSPEGAYGTSVLTFLESHSSESWSIAGVYAPLKRLARTGLLTCNFGSPTPIRGGKRKRLYELTARGVRELSNMKSESDRYWSGVSFNLQQAQRGTK